jgi:murein DD-endopeptidase MepM/ murein hydrolase activator NlpD
VAVSDGSITRITADPQLGLTIEATHGTVAVLYAQVTSIRVQQGDQVKQGQVLAVVGEPAGAEKGMPPHLHFAVRPAGRQAPVDPAFYLGLGGSKH